VDYSLHRLRHYTGTAPELPELRAVHQLPVLHRRVRALGHAAMQDPTATTSPSSSPATWSRAASACRQAGDEYGAEPPRLPQMPAYHLLRADRTGITMVNIGVGPANAKTITDHIAVLRPHAWIMLGHCAGLRNTQQLGDYVLAHGYVREDHVLDEELPLWVPIPALAEIQVALEQAVADVTQMKGYGAQAHHAHRHRGQHRQPQLGTAARTTARSGASARAARWRWTWKAPPSPPTASASACPTAPCCA
jgi:AMP nucleosidase